MKSTVLVWGSLRLILAQLFQTRELLDDLLGMLEDLSFSLPRLRGFGNDLPTDQGFQASLATMYTYLICFCARTVLFLRLHPHTALRQNALPGLRKDCNYTTQNLKYLASVVHFEAELVLTKRNTERNSETWKSETNKVQTRVAHETLGRQWPIQHKPNNRFRGRQSLLNLIPNLLKSVTQALCPTILCLSGMAGVGKTQIALEYAFKHYRECGDVFWISAENKVAFSRSCSKAADQLKLRYQLSATSDGAIPAFKQWLTDTSESTFRTLPYYHVLNIDQRETGY